ncbi:hypothetical protein [Micromonospora sp. HM5-17]|uniref:hypothetical protein n=1 Tax=Micromonospora sp. HM5-17 TaxID=2487710 RepID=UPI0011CDF312|nr:hypothetical protein [Micromonospora sp. HM5-17]
MAQDAEYGCAEDEPNALLGGHEPPHPFGPAVNRLRWVCGASVPLPAAPLDGAQGRPAGEPARRAVGSGEPDGAPGEPDGRPGLAGSSTAPAQIPERSRVIPRPRSGEQGPRTGLVERDPEPRCGSGGVAEPAGPGQGGAGADERHWSECRTNRPGWAGGHRHGAVRPARRIIPRDRPPRRWC